MAKILEKVRKVIFLVLGVGLYLNLSLFSDESLILHLKMDEGKGDILNDSSGYYNNGKIYGAKWVKDEEIGRYVLAFDGEDDFVSLPSSINGKAVEVWFKTEAVGGGVLIHNARSWSGCWPNYRYGLTINKKGTLYVIVGGGGKNHITLESKEVVNTGKWVQAVVTFDDKNIYLYINGKLDSKTSYDFNIVSSQFFTIGAEYNNYNAYVIKKAEEGVEKYKELIKKWKERYEKENPGKKFTLSIKGWPVYSGFYGGLMKTVKVYDKTLSAEDVKKSYEMGIK